MTGEVDPFDFTLAEALHMTVGDLRERMGNDEYIAWQAFYTWREAQRELATKTAKVSRG